MMNKENLLKFIGLCKKSGKLNAGYDQVLETLEKGKTKLIILSQDAGNSTKKSIKRAAENKNVRILELFSKEEIGDILGERDVAVLSICDKGFADSILKKAAIFTEVAANGRI